MFMHHLRPCDCLLGCLYFAKTLPVSVIYISLRESPNRTYLNWCLGPTLRHCWTSPSESAATSWFHLSATLWLLVGRQVEQQPNLGLLLCFCSPASDCTTSRPKTNTQNTDVRENLKQMPSQRLPEKKKQSASQPGWMDVAEGHEERNIFLEWFAETMISNFLSKQYLKKCHKMLLHHWMAIVCTVFTPRQTMSLALWLIYQRERGIIMADI